MSDDLAAWLRLWRAPGIGPRAYLDILARFDHPAAFFGASRAQQQRSGIAEEVLTRLGEIDEAGVEADLRWLEASDHHLLRVVDTAYPQALQAIAYPPPILFVIGDPSVLARPQIAIVGSRTPSRGGDDNAFAFAEYLAASGLTVTSGLAHGIDAAAHRGALAGGATVAVMGTGPDRVYPARHRELAHSIAERGALVTEFATGIGARREHFPRRNRIISGLSLGVLVVEAGLRSGSLVTARHALDQGREIFAIPGSIHNPLARGCHALIRQGAKLVECGDDMLEELPPLASEPSTETGAAPSTPVNAGSDPHYERLLEALGHDPVPFDVLLQRTGLTPDMLSSMLLILELKGLVAASPGGRYARSGAQGC